MPIVPDTKDWTWVLERRCPECGFDSSKLPVEEVSLRIRDNADEWHSILSRPVELLRRRSNRDRWSPLEYACHVRDVFALYRQRLLLMLTMDNPIYPNWDQDQTALENRYNAQDPRIVASQLMAAADALAATFDTIGGDTWECRGRRSDGAEFSVATFSRYLIHDPIHHLHDVATDLAILTRRVQDEDPAERR